MSDLLRSIRELLAYTIWADRAILDALREVRAEDVTRDTGTSFGSILGTLVHMLGTEQLWLSRVLGNPLTTLPSPEQFPDRLSLALGFEELWPQLEFYMASLADEQLATELTWINLAGETHTRPLRTAILHFVNHSTYHRGQVASMLRQMGYSPPATDFVYFAAGG
jgi:uncharacterized damage-inducible protein DinB